MAGRRSAAPLGRSRPESRDCWWKIIRTAAPWIDGGAIGFEGVMAHRVADTAVLLLAAEAEDRRIGAVRNQSRMTNAAALGADRHQKQAPQYLPPGRRGPDVRNRRTLLPRFV